MTVHSSSTGVKKKKTKKRCYKTGTCGALVTSCGNHRKAHRGVLASPAQDLTVKVIEQ